MAALGNSSCRNLFYSFHNLMLPLCLPIVSVILLQTHWKSGRKVCEMNKK